MRVLNAGIGRNPPPAAGEAGGSHHERHPSSQPPAAQALRQDAGTLLPDAGGHRRMEFRLRSRHTGAGAGPGVAVETGPIRLRWRTQS